MLYYVYPHWPLNAKSFVMRRGVPTCHWDVKNPPSPDVDKPMAPWVPNPEPYPIARPSK